MFNLEDIEDFFEQKSYALVGYSRDKKKFGNIIYEKLKKEGYRMYCINKSSDQIKEIRAFPSLIALPDYVDGIIVCIKPEESLNVVKDALAVGIKKVWFQVGSESDEAIDFCENNGITCIYGYCILMFADVPGFHHKVHKMLLWLMRGLPE